MLLCQYIATATIALCSAAIVLNLLVIIVVGKTPCNMGKFKYFFILFAIFEFGYAALVCVMMPMFKVLEHRLIVFPYGSLIYKSSIAPVAIGLHCSFFEIWIVFVALIFLYRYLHLCREDLVWKIEKSFVLKALLLVVYLTHVAYSIICGVKICFFKLPKVYEEQVKEEFGMVDVEQLPYVGVSVLTENDEFNVIGAFSIANHFIMVGFSTVTITFCGMKMWKKICEMSENACIKRRNKQIFFAISLQALNPLILYLIPTIIMFTYTLIDSKSPLGFFIQFVPLLWVFGKVFDPLCVLIVITEYRNALKVMLCGCATRNKHTQNSFTSSSNYMNSVVTPQTYETNQTV